MRSQAKKEDKPVKPLKVADRVDISVGRDQLIEMQQEDETLKKILQRVIEKKQNDNSDVQFRLKNGILCRHCKSFGGREVSQVVLLSKLRDRVLQIAHNTIMSGYQGRKKTQNRIWTQFWWPGLNGDVTRFCRSYDVCQRTVAKGKV